MLPNENFSVLSTERPPPPLKNIKLNLNILSVDIQQIKNVNKTQIVFLEAVTDLQYVIGIFIRRKPVKVNAIAIL